VILVEELNCNPAAVELKRREEEEEGIGRHAVQEVADLALSTNFRFWKLA
jgi:hypothetical protein